MSCKYANQFLLFQSYLFPLVWNADCSQVVCFNRFMPYELEGRVLFRQKKGKMEFHSCRWNKLVVLVNKCVQGEFCEWLLPTISCTARMLSLSCGCLYMDGEVSIYHWNLPIYLLLNNSENRWLLKVWVCCRALWTLGSNFLPLFC